jgi:hypothetical protein
VAAFLNIGGKHLGEECFVVGDDDGLLGHARKSNGDRGDLNVYDCVPPQLISSHGARGFTVGEAGRGVCGGSHFCEAREMNGELTLTLSLSPDYRGEGMSK